LKVKRVIKRYFSLNRYFSQSNINTGELELVEFRKLSTNDRYDLKYKAWSRVYEYPVVLDCISKYLGRKDISIHNSSWGFGGIHIVFKEDLESSFESVVNSDILHSDEPNTAVLDITAQPPEEYINKFDVVINVSTVEEVDADHLEIIKNLLMQVRVGGYLIITFDLPGMQLRKLERLFNISIACDSNDLNGKNSNAPELRYSKFNCGLLVVEKIK
jgi:hypothetical protein